jgi:hypothetical protein
VPHPVQANRHGEAKRRPRPGWRYENRSLAASASHRSPISRRLRGTVVAQFAPETVGLGVCQPCWKTTLAREHSPTTAQARSSAGRHRKEWLAHISAFLLQHAAQAGRRHQGPTRAAPALHHPEHNECLYQSHCRRANVPRTAWWFGACCRPRSAAGPEQCLAKQSQRMGAKGYRLLPSCISRIGSNRLMRWSLRLVAGGGFEPPTFGL